MSEARKNRDWRFGKEIIEEIKRKEAGKSPGMMGGEKLDDTIRDAEKERLGGRRARG